MTKVDEPTPTRPNDARRPFRPLPEWAGPTTRLVHGGARPDLNAGAIVPPVYQTSTFRYPSSFSEAAEHGATYLYSRNGNPTVEVAEEILRDLEGGEAARLFASGMGAISSSLFSLLGQGDELLLPTGVYGGTSELVRSTLPRFGIRVREVPEDPSADPRSVVRPDTKVVFLETPTNPVLRVHDIAAWSEAAHARGAVVVVDNTIASPVNQNPLAEGADLVVHSATKYLGGHADLTAGVAIGRSELLGRIDPRQVVGAPLDPLAAFLLQRSLRTLSVRMERINENARAVAAALAADPNVLRVHYPGRCSAVEERVAARQMRGRGGLVSFVLRGGASAEDRFLRALRIIQVASSFGGVESLASLPRATSHRAYSERELTSLGIVPGFVRLSVGIEDGADIARDLHEAIAAAHGGELSPSQPPSGRPNHRR